MPEIADSGPVEVFSGNPWQAGLVKSMLEDNGIDAYLHDMIIGTLVPWYAAPGGAGAVKIFVSPADLDRALAVVEEYNRNVQE